MTVCKILIIALSKHLLFASTALFCKVAKGWQIVARNWLYRKCIMDPLFVPILCFVHIIWQRDCLCAKIFDFIYSRMPTSLIWLPHLNKFACLPFEVLAVCVYRRAVFTKSAAKYWARERERSVYVYIAACTRWRGAMRKLRPWAPWSARFRFTGTGKLDEINCVMFIQE